MRVDRRWEFELLTKMKDKLMSKTKEKVKATVKGIVWDINYASKVSSYLIRTYASSNVNILVNPTTILSIYIRGGTASFTRHTFLTHAHLGRRLLKTAGNRDSTRRVYPTYAICSNHNIAPEFSDTLAYPSILCWLKPHNKINRT